MSGLPSAIFMDVNQILTGLLGLKNIRMEVFNI